MAFSIRKLGKNFFIISNVVVSLVFLLACLQPWLNPETFWLISFLSLLLPYLLIVLLAFLVFWFFFKIRLMLIPIATILLGWKQVSVIAGLTADGFAVGRKNNRHAELRIMTWNVKSMAGLGQLNREEKQANARKIFALIKKYQPDVVCLQEFGQYDAPEIGRDNQHFMEELGYKYMVLSKDYSRAVFGYSSGLAIFSKHLIVGKKRIQFTSSPESLLYADILFKNDTIRVFTSHLQSFKFSGTDYRDLERIRNTEDSLVEASANIFEKMKRAFRNRGSQADQIRPYLDSCTGPEIFCGDLNDVPNSYAYWHIKGDRTDAFLDRGFGIGRTFISLAPTLRIDYILADPAWEVEQCTTVSNKLSDHQPVIADLKLTK